MAKVVAVVLSLIILILGVPGLSFAVLDGVVNGSFERDTDSDGIPDDWSGRHLGADDVRVEGGFAGLYSFRFLGRAGVRKSLRQAGRARLPQGSRITFRAYAKTSGADPSGGVFVYKIDLLYLDDTSESIVLKLPFSDDWALAEQAFVLPKDLKRIAYRLIFADQTGTAWLDAIQALAEPPGS